MSLIQWLRASIVRQYLVALLFIGFLAVLAAAPALVLTEQSTGSGGAINVSGSMRMQSYKLALAVADPFSSYDQRKEMTLSALDEFGAKLMSPGLLKGVPYDAMDQYHALKDRYETSVRPLAEASIDDLWARKEFTKQIPVFVEDVDRFVQTLENGLNNRLALLQKILTVILLGAVLVSFVMLMMMQRSIFKPLLEIGRAADAVRQGDFSVRTKAPAPNEIGRLSTSFNFMVDELGRLYGNLENEVARKTQDLNRRNAGLQFLSRVAQAVTWRNLSERHALDGLLTEAAQQLGAKALRIRVGQGDKDYVLAQSVTTEAATDLFTGDSSEHFSLSTDKAKTGFLDVKFEATPEAWQRDLSQAMAQTVGRGIERSFRQADDRRLAVLEERSTIARELHDSIAQSLSYSRIQMHRLKVFIEREEPREKVLQTVTELSEGIATAYSQLREVLTTFRLQINSSGLNGAVEETVEEFRNRTGIATTVTNELLGIELSPNEQIHFIHILREALINIEKHARATNVSVRMMRSPEGGFVLKVEDDGIGIGSTTGKYKHFGLSIMRERAEALHGTLSVAPGHEKGTCVTLTVPEREA
ncbi:MAG: HAMP domain-containing protein [Sutterella wadsworthensis]|nr:HAMP domain-containing protein [Sutterella wadsworthensis]